MTLDEHQDEIAGPFSYSVKTAVRDTGLSRTRLFEALAAGAIEARKNGNRLIIDGRSLRRFVRSLPLARTE